MTTTTTSITTTTRTISQLLLIMSIQMLILLMLVIIINKNGKNSTIDCINKVDKDSNGTVCPEHYFGNVANPDDCSSFYLCLGGTNKILLRCPKHYYFSIDTNQCEPADRVDCGNRPKNDITS
jgi:hypothetical protein